MEYSAKLNVVWFKQMADLSMCGLTVLAKPESPGNSKAKGRGNPILTVLTVELFDILT